MSSSESEPLPVRIAASNPELQQQSSLFKFTPEVRNIVFKYALVECDDLSRPYNKHEPYYRHDFKFAGKIATSLLLTCRRIYLEARLLPFAVNDHIFWQGGAPPGRFVSNHAAYFARMSDEQRALVRCAHFFADLDWLDRQNASVDWPAGLALRKLTITVRPTGWKYRYLDDYDDFVGVLHASNPSNCWGGWVGNMSTLEELELELESERGEQLDDQVLKACMWKFPLSAGGFLVYNGQEPAKSMRLASSRMDPAREDEDSQAEDSWEGGGTFDRTHWRGSDDEGSEDGTNSYGLADSDGDFEDQSRADSQTVLDRKYPLDLVIYVRTIKFVKDETDYVYIPSEESASDSDSYS
ncbi:hypothetical protein B0H11DRAFT_485296 [Mycena galericulata]|nr:hypothetical protein B0H11DRAFT_485296 [Mycena galericulata]